MPKKFNCKTCNSEFESKKACKSREPKYCSKECYSKSLIKEMHCKLCNSEIKSNGSTKHNRIFCSKECQTKSRIGKELSNEWRNALSIGRKKSIKCRGENLYNWKGGKATESIRAKESFYRRKRSLKEKMPLDYLQRLLIVQNNKCFYCENDLKKYKAIEHLTPVSRGGDNHFYNLVYSCKSCNSKKGQKTLEEYAINKNMIYLIDKFDYFLYKSL